jgi:hypothetical protein
MLSALFGDCVGLRLAAYSILSHIPAPSVHGAASPRPAPYRGRFFVLNQRFDIAFYYFYNIKTTNGSVPAYTSAGVVAQTVVRNPIANQPTQGHLTFSGVPGCAGTSAHGY